MLSPEDFHAVRELRLRYKRMADEHETIAELLGQLATHVIQANQQAEQHAARLRSADERLVSIMAKCWPEAYAASLAAESE